MRPTAEDIGVAIVAKCNTAPKIGRIFRQGTYAGALGSEHLGKKSCYREIINAARAHYLLLRALVPHDTGCTILKKRLL